MLNSVATSESPFHAESRWEGNRQFGHVTNARTRGLDGIPFDHRLSMNLEIWRWEATTMAYAATTYWYAPRARCNRPPDEKQAARAVLP